MNDINVKGPTDCWMWLKSPDTAPNNDAKMACDNPMCCNPRHVVAQPELDKVGYLVFMKKSLDDAGIKYRANASMEALEDLMEEHGL